MACSAIKINEEERPLWTYPAESLYYCIDSHGDESGTMSLAELVIAIHEGAEAGVIPPEAVDSFLDNVDLAPVLEGHMDEETAKACGIEDDGKIMAGELKDCIEKHIGEASDKDEAGQEVLARLHAVDIPLKMAGEGLAATLAGTGLAEDKWHDAVAEVAEACW